MPSKVPLRPAHFLSFAPPSRPQCSLPLKALAGLQPGKSFFSIFWLKLIYPKTCNPNNLSYEEGSLQDLILGLHLLGVVFSEICTNKTKPGQHDLQS